LSTRSPRSRYEKLASIINVLGDPDTLRILDEAGAGFESGKATIRELNLTPRKYYRSLRKLNEMGLVASFENRYKLTSLGEFMHKLLLNHASAYLLADQSLLKPLEKVGSKSELRVIDSYKDLISLLVTVIEKSKSEILLATRYVDMVVVQSIVFALQRDIKAKTITSESVDFSSFIKLLGSFMRNIRPDTLKFVLGGENNYRSGDVPLSFMIVDGEITVFEIPDREFRVAFVSTDKEIEKILSRLFWEIWKQSKALHMPSL
jgi:sugar-specific transcriptional regulator TrmB